MEMSSSDQIPFTRSGVLSLNELGVLVAILGLDNENVYNSHTFC